MFGAIVALVGMAISMYGQQQQAKAQSEMADYNAKVAEVNAEADAQSIAAERRHRMTAIRTTSGQLRNSFIGRGIDYESDSPLLILTKEARDSQYDILELKRQEDNTRSVGAQQASLLKIKSKNIRTAGNLAMAGTAVQGVGSSYSAYQSGKTAKYYKKLAGE